MKYSRRTLLLTGLAFQFAFGLFDVRADETTAAQQVSEQINPEAQKIIDQEMENRQRKEAGMFPCRLFTQSEIEALVGNSLDRGSYAFNNVTENDRRYKSESCSWSAAHGQGNEASLWVSLPKHFESGRVECSPGSTDRKVSGIGDQAWWEYQKFFGMGTLRVCSAKAMLEVKVDLTDTDEAKARKIAETLAEKVLSSQ